MPEFVDWGAARDRAALVQQAVAPLDAGGWVAFPTETGYALAARSDRPQALNLIEAEGLRWSLALPESAELEAWTGALSTVARRLVRRSWPGPVCFEFEGAGQTGPTAQFSQAIRERIAPGGNLALRRPAHDAILNVLAALDQPLVLAEPNHVNLQWLASLGEAVNLVFEAGAPRFDRPATRVRIAGDSWVVTSPGVYDAAELRRLTACLILFICTGNTCRSPMAEALCKVQLAHKLGCRTEELPERGYWVMSAGVAAYAGDSSPEEAQRAVAAYGGDVSGHRSRPVRPELAAVADFIVGMTASHLAALREVYPDLGAVPRLLCGTEDLTDPLGSDQEVYDECAKLIQDHLEALVKEVTGP